MKATEHWYRVMLLAVIFTLCGATGFTLPATAAQGTAPAVDRPDSSREPSASRKSKNKKKKGTKGAGSESGTKDKEKPFEAVVKDTEKVEGLFTFYRDTKQDKVFMEILPDQLNKDFIYSAKVERATGERGFYGTLMMDEYVFQWQQMGKQVQMVRQNTRFRAEPGTPAHRAVEKSFSDSLVGSAKIASQPHPERKSLLVDLNDIFLNGDFHDVGSYLSETYKGRFQPDKENSEIALVKSFPLNSEIGTVTRFKGSNVKEYSVTVPDARSFDIQFRYSLVAMPENDYMPRLADDRLGYFLDMHMDYTSDRDSDPYVRYVTRWKLKKQDPEADLSDPVEPIVFWVENSVPERYRQWFRDGIELWNPAFEKAGFRNAVVAKQQPDDADWDPADMRYNTIRWFVGYDATFAIGPSHTNPYTGQILDADIGVSEGILRLGARRRYQVYVDPVSKLEALTKTSHGMAKKTFGSMNSRNQCDYGEELVEHASMVYDIMSAREGWTSDQEREFVRQYVTELVAHEVGHTLGLRHNFQASTLNRPDQLSDSRRNKTVGLGASVMDYNPAIIALEGETQGDYFPTVVGSYDQWVIEYGYRPIPGAEFPEDELPELRGIASRAPEGLHPYATDEDAGLSPRALDPRNTRYDFSSDPLEWFSHEYRLIGELWKNYEKELLKEGESYEILRRAFGYTWTPYFRGAHVAMKYLGGIYHNRDHVGDPSGQTPFVPVPAEEQRRALQFLAEEIWAPDTFVAPAELVRKLQFSRHYDFEYSVYTTPRLDYPIHDSALFVQSEIFNDLYHPIKLGRMLDMELMFTENPFTMADMFTGIRDSVWSELGGGSNINSFRRNLQREHLEHLIQLTLRPLPQTPEDARSLARADLETLRDRIQRALGRNPDYTTRAHLRESMERIQRALDAPMQRGV